MGKSLRQSAPIALLFFSCLLPSIPHETAASSEGPEIDAARLYLQWCSQCHGISGRGDGVNSTPDMAINPRDHTDSAYMSTRSDEQIREIIEGGGTGLAKSPLMPPWGATLAKAEIDALVRYLRELCRCGYEGLMTHEKLRTVDPSFR